MEIFYFGLKCVKPRCTSTYYIRNQHLRHSFDYLQRFCEHVYIEHSTANEVVV